MRMFALQTERNVSSCCRIREVEQTNTTTRDAQSRTLERPRIIIEQWISNLEPVRDYESELRLPTSLQRRKYFPIDRECTSPKISPDSKLPWFEFFEFEILFCPSLIISGCEDVTVTHRLWWTRLCWTIAVLMSAWWISRYSVLTDLFSLLVSEPHDQSIVIGLAIGGGLIILAIFLALMLFKR